MKGQSIVIQFIVFFLIGLSVLISVSQFFNYQASLFKESGSNLAGMLVNTFVSSQIVQIQSSCKYCDFVVYATRIPNKTIDYYFNISFRDNRLVVEKVPGEKVFISSIHNLNETLTLAPSFSSSVQPITLTLNKTKNYLQVS